jgi:hypothetical protein
MHKKGLLLLILLVILNAGCATFTVKKDYRIAEGTNMGLVAVSFTQPFPVMKWMYRDLREGKGSRGLNERFVSTTDMLNQLIKYDDTVIYTVELPAGEYEFFRWTTPEAGTFIRSTHDFSVKFKSVAGKVSYIGNIFVFMAGRNYGILIRDNRAKEITLLRQHFQNIREDQIEVHLMEHEAAGQRGPEKPRRLPGIEALDENRPPNEGMHLIARNACSR